MSNLLPFQSNKLAFSPARVQENKSRLNLNRTSAHPAFELLCLALILASASILFFSRLGDYPLFNPDEGLYAEPAREMLETGQYVTTLLNYAVRFTKPPLTIWAMALSYKVFGVNEFAARFFGASSALLLVAITYLFASRYLTRRSSVLAACILMQSPLFIGCAREAITDMPLSLFMSGSLISLYHAFMTRKSFWLVAGYALIGLSVMTKGPVGLILPLLILGIFHFADRTLKEAWSFYRLPLGMLIVSLIALPWFILEIYLTHGAYFFEFIIRENFQRFTSVVDHKGAWWYHSAALCLGLFPWSLFLPRSIWKATTADGTRQDGNIQAQRPSQSTRTCRFALIWLSVTVVFFSLAVSKLIPYTLPAFPAAAILIAFALDMDITQKRLQPLLFSFLLLGLIYTVGASLAPFLLSRLKDTPPLLLSAVQSWAQAQLSATVIACLFVCRKRLGSAIAVMLASIFIASILYGSQLVTIISDYWEEPLTHLAAYAAISDWPIVVYDLRKPSVPFYTRRKVIQPGSREDLLALLAQNEHGYILTRSKNRASIESLNRCRIIFQSGQFILAAWQPHPVVELPKLGH